MKILINFKETQWSREALLGALALCVCVCEGCIKWHLKEKWPELLAGPFFAGMKKAAEQQAIPLLIDLMSARGSAKKNKAVGSDGCPSEFWKYLSCVSMVVIFRLFLMRLLAMEDGRNVDSPH